MSIPNKWVAYELTLGKTYKMRTFHYHPECSPWVP